MKFSGGDLTWLVYQAPPRWDGEKFVNGEKFFLSGNLRYQGQNDLGVDMNLDITGLERDQSSYRWDTPAEAPSSTFVGINHNKREITGSVNIYGKNAREVRDNKRRWFSAHPDKLFGKLWAFTSDGEPRYLWVVKSETAGLSSLPKDPGIRGLYEKFEWSWVSDDAPWRGYESTQTLTPRSDGSYKVSFYNPSTWNNVYPVIYLPGPGTWTIDKGNGRGTYTSPTIADGEVLRIDYNPLNQTLLKKTKSGTVQNIWATMTGDRPMYRLDPEAWNTFTVVGSNKNLKPQLVYTPLFTSWN